MAESKDNSALFIVTNKIPELHGFDWALQQIRDGIPVKRNHWQHNGYVKFNYDPEEGLPVRPQDYNFVMHTTFSDISEVDEAWWPNKFDILCMDWTLYIESNDTVLHTFDWAVKQIINGAPIRRHSWPAGNILCIDTKTLLLTNPPKSKCTIILINKEGICINRNWTATTDDIMANDWVTGNL